MNKLKIVAMALFSVATVGVSAQVYVRTDAYRWQGDSIIQGEFTAYAPDDTTLISNYSAQPHYFMPIDKKWTLKNDISDYPRLVSGNRLHNAVYNMALDEMVNAVEPDTTLRTGKEWAGVWTRDVSYSIILSMAHLQPEASKISLMKKVNANGRIVQDTGSGGAWPVSSDRQIWTVAAYQLYKVTGDRQWLEFIYPIIKNSIEDDLKVVLHDGLINGETSFIDWREQSYPKWMQTADIYASQASGTGAVFATALDILSEIAVELGHADEAEKYASCATDLKQNLVGTFWMPENGYMAMYTYGDNFPILNPRSETLGQAFGILNGLFTPEQASSITQNVPVTPYGPAIFYPQISDMPAYHNNSLWPWVGAFWTLANARTGNEQGVMNGIGSVFRPAALFTTNKENFNLDNGDIATELNSSNMLWCLAGNLAITYNVLFGIDYQTDGLHIAPFVPKVLEGERSLLNYPYRNATLNITVRGYGDTVSSMTVNGVENSSRIIPTNASGVLDVVVTMNSEPIAPMAVNHQPNRKAPITPITRLSNDPSLDGKNVPVNNLLNWNPIEYIAGYIVLRDGKPVEETRQTTYAATIPGVYQVIGVSSEGIQSFASEPLSNYPVIYYNPLIESTEMHSREVSYHPDHAVKGYSGSGFAEIDHNTAPLSFKVKAKEEGRYSISFRYANGNGPINTENKCAIRTVLVDGRVAGTIVMPHRGVGNWDDWGLTNSVSTDLTKGQHTITVVFEPYDENMNLGTNHALIDRLELTRLF